MKLAVRILALSVVVAGGAAAAVTPKTAPAIQQPPGGDRNSAHSRAAFQASRPALNQNGPVRQ